MHPWHEVEVKRFFEDYKVLEQKTVIVEEFLDRTEALETIWRAMDLYRQNKEQLISHGRV